MKNFTKIAFSLAIAASAAPAINAQSATDWINVEVSTPGSLGVEILYKAEKLADVTHLRVSGNINADDWTTIKNLSKIQELDLVNAGTTSIPESAFSSRSSLSSIKLPATLTSIGKDAFNSTSSLSEITFPASLTSIGNQAFYNSGLERFYFEAGSRLSSMGTEVFNYCKKLQTASFDVEAPLTNLNTNTFNDCTSLTEVTLPNAVTRISGHAFYNTPSLSYITLPENLTRIDSWAFYNSGLISLILPSKLSTVDNYVFNNCKNLTEVLIPSTLHSLSNSMFSSCSALTEITCLAPTPPTVGSSTFSSVSKANVTLTVPEFAVPDYKLDPNWLSFGTILGGAESDFWDIAGKVSLTNDRRMPGTPSITLQAGGSLTVSGNAAMTVDELTFNYDHGYTNYNSVGYSQLLNSCPLMSANDTKAVYYMRSDSWRDISLPFDVKAADIYHSIPSAAFAIRFYDGAERAANNATGKSWKNVPEDTVIKAGTGIIIQTNTEGYITFPCVDNGQTTVFNPNSVSMALDRNAAESSTHSGWNFVANPFPTYYDLYYSTLTCPITVYDAYSQNYNAYSLIDDNVVLSPSQPFFIQASQDISQIVFSIQGRQLSATVSRGVKANLAADSNRALFNLSLAANGLEDAARIVLNPEASAAYELSRDASKFMSSNPEMPQIYSLSAEGEYLAINELPADNTPVRLGFYAPAAGAMALSMPRVDGTAILHDAVAGKSISIESGEEYVFTVEEGGYDDSRFSLELGSGVATGVDLVVDGVSAVTVSVEGNAIVVEGAQGQAVSIYSLDGKTQISDVASADRVAYSLDAGVYIVNTAGRSAKCIIR